MHGSPDLEATTASCRDRRPGGQHCQQRHRRSPALRRQRLPDHQSGTHDGPFSKFTVGLDHVCLTVDSAETLAAWRRHLEAHGAGYSYERSEWGHHINLRDPDNIAVELFLLEPDEASAEILARADGVSS